MDHDPGHAPFRNDRSSELTLDIACKHIKFDDVRFSCSEGISWGVKFQSWSRDPDHAPFRDGLSPVDSLGHAMVNLPIKFEVPVFTRHGNMKGVAKCRKWRGLGWLGVTQGH